MNKYHFDIVAVTAVPASVYHHLTSLTISLFIQTNNHFFRIKLRQFHLNDIVNA